jgi:hypothetical protein
MKKFLAGVLALLLLCGILAGCGAKAEVSSNGAADYYAPMTPSESEKWDDVILDKDFPTGSTVTKGEDIALSGEKIIYYATISLETLEFEKTITALEEAVKNAGGFIQNSSVNGDTSYDENGVVQVLNRRAHYSVRVPADQLEEFLHFSGTLGNVIASSKEAENVTSRYTDLEARMASLKTEQTRLLELMEKASDINALIALEERLSAVRYEIESIQRNLDNLDSLLAYSTVTFTIREVRTYKASVTVQRTFFQRLGDSFGGGWDRFVEGLENFCIGIAGSVFPLLLLAVAVVVVVLVVKKQRKKVKKTAPKDEDAK